MPTKFGILLGVLAFGVSCGGKGPSANNPSTGPSPSTPPLYSGTFKGTSTITACIQAPGLPVSVGFCANDPARRVGVIWPATAVFQRSATEMTFPGWFQFFENGVGQLRYSFTGTIQPNDALYTTIRSGVAGYVFVTLVFEPAFESTTRYTGFWEIAVDEQRGVPGDNAGTLKGSLTLTKTTPCAFDVIC